MIPRSEIKWARLANLELQAFEKHIERVYNSEEFKKKANEAQQFFTELKDFTFGRPTTLENIVSFSVGDRNALSRCLTAVFK